MINIITKQHLVRLAIYFIAAFAAGLVFGCALAALTAPEDTQPEPLCPAGCKCDSSYFVLDCPDIQPKGTP